MKFSTCFRFFTCMIIASIATIVFTTLVIAKPLTQYESALNAASEERWNDAVNLLNNKKSHNATENYLLAVCWSRMHDPLKTMQFANDALEGTPKLKSQFVDAAMKLLKWAALVISSQKKNSMSVSLLMSIENESQNEPLSAKREKLREKEIDEIDKEFARTKHFVNIDKEISNGQANQLIENSMSSNQKMINELENISMVATQPTLPILVLPIKSVQSCVEITHCIGGNR